MWKKRMLTDRDYDSMRKILWERLEPRADKPGIWIRAYALDDVPPRGKVWGLNEYELNHIQEWTKEHKCGLRMSFDTYKFKNEAELTMFLLRWAN
jgi:hypothetical protein